MYLKMRREGLPVSRWALRVGQCPPKGEGPEEWAKQALTAGKGGWTRPGRASVLESGIQLRIVGSSRVKVTWRWF